MGNKFWRVSANSVTWLLPTAGIECRVFGLVCLSAGGNDRGSTPSCTVKLSHYAKGTGSCPLQNNLPEKTPLLPKAGGMGKWAAVGIPDTGILSSCEKITKPSHLNQLNVTLLPVEDNEAKLKKVAQEQT